MNYKLIEVNIVKPFNIITAKVQKVVAEGGVDYPVGVESMEFGANQGDNPIIAELGLTDLATLLWSSDIISAWNTHLASIADPVVDPQT
jgi:hypothetical protein